MVQDLAFSAIRIATPLIFASMGGLLTFKAGILNIALDGFMIVAAFAAVVTAYLTGSLTLGILAGVVSAMALAGLLARGVGTTVFVTWYVGNVTGLLIFGAAAVLP